MAGMGRNIARMTVSVIPLFEFLSMDSEESRRKAIQKEKGEEKGKVKKKSSFRKVNGEGEVRKKSSFHKEVEEGKEEKKRKPSLRKVAEEGKDSFDTGKKLPLTSSITLSNIFFRYPSSPSDVLLDVSLSFPKGKTTALVGRSGAGKTTITQILMGLYRQTSGTMSWDGITVTERHYPSLRKSISFVEQDPSLFNRTIEENISFGVQNATKEQIKRAARDAYAHKFIMQTAYGYQSMVGERGIKLSGGQRQRIAIARALIMNPDVLILDESTSQLDSESEKAIQAYINKAHPDRVQVIIAHRLSTIRNAHNIVVVNDGRVEAQGTYEELLSTCSLFHTFHELQASNFEKL
jgi:subfamily B ATP-binding cassette protein MsbA